MGTASVMLNPVAQQLAAVLKLVANLPADDPDAVLALGDSTDRYLARPTSRTYTLEQPLCYHDARPSMTTDMTRNTVHVRRSGWPKAALIEVEAKSLGSRNDHYTTATLGSDRPVPRFWVAQLDLTRFGGSNPRARLA